MILNVKPSSALIINSNSVIYGNETSFNSMVAFNAMIPFGGFNLVFGQKPESGLISVINPRNSVIYNIKP